MIVVAVIVVGDCCELVIVVGDCCELVIVVGDCCCQLSFYLWHYVTSVLFVISQEVQSQSTQQELYD